LRQQAAQWKSNVTSPLPFLSVSALSDRCKFIYHTPLFFWLLTKS